MFNPQCGHQSVFVAPMSVKLARMCQARPPDYGFYFQTENIMGRNNRQRRGAIVYYLLRHDILAPTGLRTTC